MLYCMGEKAMRLQEFDMSKAAWDAYQAFHIRPSYGKGYVQFLTGEVLITTNAPKPEVRNREINNMRFMYTYTADRAIKLRLPDGTPVPYAWLDYAGIAHNGGVGYYASFSRESTRQYLLIDMDTKRAVALDWRNMDKKNVASNFTHGTAMFAKPGAEPIGGEIRFAPPIKLTSEEKEYVSSLQAAVKAIVQIEEITAYPDRYAPYHLDIDKAMSTYATPLDFINKLREYDKRGEIIRQIDRLGIEVRRRVYTAPYMLADV